MNNQSLNDPNENNSKKNEENNSQANNKFVKPLKKEISESINNKNLKKNECNKPRVSYAMALSNGLKVQSKNKISNQSNLNILSLKNSCDTKMTETNQFINKTFNHIDLALEKIIFKLKKFESASTSKKNNMEDNLSKSLSGSETIKKKNQISEFDKESFFEMIKSEFKCSICQEVIVNATNLNCSHTFCQNCINAWLYKNLKCPICRVSFTNKQHVLPIDNFLNFFYQKFCPETEAKSRAKLVKEHLSQKKKDNTVFRSFFNSSSDNQFRFQSERLNNNQDAFNRIDNFLSTNSLPNMRIQNSAQNFLQRRLRNNQTNELNLSSGISSNTDNLSMEVNASIIGSGINNLERSRESSYRSLRNMRNSSQNNSRRNNRPQAETRNNFDVFFDIGNISRHRVNLKDRTIHRFNNLQRRASSFRERRMLRRTRRDNFNDFILDREN